MDQGLNNKTCCSTDQTRSLTIDRSSEELEQWKEGRGTGMFSNKVDLMETLISWVVCTTLFLVLLYSIVGTTITL